MALNQIVKATEIANAGDYPAKRLNQRERKVLEVADSYLPADSADWGASAPTSQDAALDALVAANPISSTQVATRRTVGAVYDFSVNGGATGDIDLGVTIPDNAIIVEVVSDILTALDSADDTVTLTLNLPTDGAISAAHTPSSSGVILLVDTTPVKATAARQLTATIATQAATAGKIQFLVTYVISQ